MADINSIKEDLKKLLFKPLERKWNSIYNAYRRPLTEITQSFKEIILDVKLPDMERKHVKMNYAYGTLELVAEKRKGKGFYVSVDLPAEVDLDKAKMTFKSNKLTITIPKVLKTSRRGK